MLDLICVIEFYTTNIQSGECDVRAVEEKQIG